MGLYTAQHTANIFNLPLVTSYESTVHCRLCIFDHQSFTMAYSTVWNYLSDKKQTLFCSNDSFKNNLKDFPFCLLLEHAVHQRLSCDYVLHKSRPVNKVSIVTNAKPSCKMQNL